MQVNKKEEDTFTPYTLEIKVESEQEHLFFHWLSYANISIPHSIVDSIDEFVGHARHHGLPKPEKDKLRDAYEKFQSLLSDHMF